MSYFKYHVFMCNNQREGGQTCCNQFGADRLRNYAKDKVKALGLNGPGKVRINSAGCLERCDQGPALVVYPDAVWYTFIDESDLDEIIESHLVQGKVVERLKI
jgi:(2Fe-2S) ferredoxin